MKVIVTHSHADFDAIASMLGAYKLNPDAVPVLPVQISRDVTEFLTLYRSGLPFVDWEDMDFQSVTGIIVTDTIHVPSLKGVDASTPVTIIDHHELDRDLAPHETWAGDRLGAITTLLVEQIKTRHIPLNRLEATLMLLGIYADTGNLTYGGTTPRDIEAAAFLLRHGADLDTVRRFNNSPLSDEQRSLLDALIQKPEKLEIHGYNIIIASAEMNDHVDGINSVTANVSQLYDPDALFVVVGMPNYVQIVARSSIDAVDVAGIMAEFSGGGHARAGAAAIQGGVLSDILARVKALLHERVKPAGTVGNIMSLGVQTVRAKERAGDVVGRLRLIGHEGFPVVNGNDEVVGLLTMRDLNRTIEHGLDGTAIEDIMLPGHVSLSPDDSIADLEQLISRTGWGQIPIVENGKLIGIVTRTDLIQHWANTRPQPDRVWDTVEPEKLQSLLGSGTYQLITTITEQANQQNIPLYLVGGLVRDVLLDRPNLDIDFVVEQDAIEFATHLQREFGGKLHTHKPFGTAKWLLSDEVTGDIAVKNDLPDHIDFATARSELYQHPTALPTVYGSGIKLDLRRRDFTINTLALQLSPQSMQWRLLDFYGGKQDLHDGIIRVLHSLSFVDDPTRIIRAVRFASRLNFTIEQHNEQLIQNALPMLRRITGERVRNELSNMLTEANPLAAFQQLEQRNILTAIHEEFAPDLSQLTHITDGDSLDVRWQILMSGLQPSAAKPVARRLLFGEAAVKQFVAVTTLMHGNASFSPDDRPSTITEALDRFADDAIHLALRLMPDGALRGVYQQYIDQWRHMQPNTNGHTLKDRGLPAGPAYRRILARLRRAWLDGEISSPDEEIALLDKLVEDEM